MLALTPAGQMVVFEPDAGGLKVQAQFKVAEGQAHAYPVVSGNRIFIKDRDSVALWSAQ